MWNSNSNIEFLVPFTKTSTCCEFVTICNRNNTNLWLCNNNVEMMITVKDYSIKQNAQILATDLECSAVGERYVGQISVELTVLFCN